MAALRCLFLGLGVTFVVACSSDAQDACLPDDQDGIVGARATVLLNVSDTGFAVGGVNSGSTQPNIAVQNLSTITLTISNVGSKPHGFQVGCRPTELPAGCPQTACFPRHRERVRNRTR